MRIRVVMALALPLLALVPGVVSGQQTTAGVIAGQVRDTTGGVLPGVTVEVASPALIEKVRTVVTDASGQYRIVDLRPGVYTVTFTLGGFGKLMRDNVQLTSGFTATVSVELKVGDIAETITVSGASPVVDVQNVTEQSVLPRTVLDAIPSGRSYTELGRLVPGIDATGNSGGGSVGGSTGRDATKLLIHGSTTTDFKLMIDGFPQMTWVADGSTGPIPAESVAEEIQLQYSALPAEVETGGVLYNMVPRTGSNVFKATLFANGANGSMQSVNLTPALQAQGLKSTGGNIDYVTDVNPSFGGPIKRDRLWYYVTYRDFRSYVYSSQFFDSYTVPFVYTPDTSRPPAFDAKPQQSVNSRITWQATQRNRFSLGLEWSKVDQLDYQIGGKATAAQTTAEATTDQPISQEVLQLSWTMPINNRLLLDVGGQIFNGKWVGNAQSISMAPGALELATGLSFRAPLALGGAALGSFPFWHDYLRGAVSYTTGSHAVKVGGNLWHGGDTNNQDAQGLGSYYVRLLNGVPNGVVYRVTPNSVVTRFLKGDFFAQDQWTLRRLTVNYGARIDTEDAGYPAQTELATAYFPARAYAAGTVIRWRDWNPRLGVSYDLFGNGKTAVKASVNRYVNWDATALSAAVNPAATSAPTLLRSWTDTNRDFIPQGDPTNPLSNGELGPSPNANWGSPVASTYDPAWAQGGWGVRGYNWSRDVSVQQELRSNVSLNVGYFYRTYGNFTVVNNTAVTASDFSTFCVTTPVDPRLPGGGGQQTCGLYDVNPAFASANQNVTTLASKFGTIDQNYKGVDVATNIRLLGVVLQGGVNTGRELYDFCGLIAQLPTLLISGTTKTPASQCHQQQPWLTQVKLLGSYQLPWALSVAATYQNAYNTTSTNPNILPGAPRMGIQASEVFSNAQIAPSLGRNLAAGANANATINVVTPGTQWGDRIQQVDLRVARTFKWGPRASIKVNADLYNALNTNVVTALNYTYGTTGAAWLQPIAILPARLLKLGVQIAY